MAVKRYKSVTKKRLPRAAERKQGTTVFRSTMPQKVQLVGDDLIYIAREGDRYDLLAYKFYGSTQFWYAIASVNGKEDGKLNVKPGTELRIPSRIRIVGS